MQLVVQRRATLRMRSVRIATGFTAAALLAAATALSAFGTPAATSAQVSQSVERFAATGTSVTQTSVTQISDVAVSPGSPTIFPPTCVGAADKATAWETVSAPANSTAVTYSAVAVSTGHVATITATLNGGYTWEQVGFGWAVTSSSTAVWSYQLQSLVCPTYTPPPAVIFTQDSEDSGTIVTVPDEADPGDVSDGGGGSSAAGNSGSEGSDTSSDASADAGSAADAGDEDASGSSDAYSDAGSSDPAGSDAAGSDAAGSGTADSDASNSNASDSNASDSAGADSNGAD